MCGGGHVRRNPEPFFCVRIYILVLFLGLPFNNYYYLVCWDSHKKKISIALTSSESYY